MAERCILAVRFTPAMSARQVGKAVGGFLRYLQHRDLHPPEAPADRAQVQGLVKYVAYRDQAAARAELFGPWGAIGSAERKRFAAFVLRSLEESRPQPYRNRDGVMVDRRRAVYRMVISPERAEGLDLRRLTVSAVSRLEQESGLSGLKWVAAIHRNTRHPHVHLVLAGMHRSDDGWHRLDLTKPRLAAMKQALALEIARQRGERIVEPRVDSVGEPARWDDRERASIPIPRKPVADAGTARFRPSLLRLRAAGLRYRRQIEREAAEEARRRGWEYAA